jgi:hypothetical protein
MGLDYSYEIFIPTRNVARALTQLAELAPRDGDTAPLEITLPGGEHLAVPFTSSFKSGPADASAGGMLDLETMLMFGADAAVREYRAVPDESHLDELGRVAIGYIYLTVRFAPAWHPQFASLEFTAATSSMSRLFERSGSVRKAFTDLTAASGGVCCLFDRETRVFDICWLDGTSVQETVPGPRFARFRDLVAAWPEQI